MGHFDSNKLTVEQEFFMMKGKVDAVIAYLRNYPYNPDKNVLLAMLDAAPVPETPSLGASGKEDAGTAPVLCEGDDW